MSKLSSEFVTDRTKAVLLLWIIFVIYVSRVILLYCQLCSLQPWGHLLKKGLTSRLYCVWCFLVFLSLSIMVSRVECGTGLYRSWSLPSLCSLIWIALRWRANDGLVVFGSCLASSNKKKKKHWQSWTPSGSTFWIRAWRISMQACTNVSLKFWDHPHFQKRRVWEPLYILPQNALRRVCNGKCIVWIEGHYVEVMVEV